jgi:APA family basic amino acid/polyamine antiporter
MKKKLNAIMVSGLTIGPVLGSGIIFLPPLAVEKLGGHAITAWLIVLALGALFAYVFTKMAVVAPDNQGISTLVGNMLGKPYRDLSANYLAGAVLFGPVVVALTAAEFLMPLLPTSMNMHPAWIAAAVLLLCALLVISGAAFMARVMLALSSLTACLLLAGSLATLVGAPALSLPRGLPELTEFGHVLLLIFWSVFGWEVLGNYVEEVDDPERTMLRAMRISLAGIISVYLLTAFALQNMPAGGMPGLLVPILGGSAGLVFGVLAAGLCVCTIVTFTGAVSRQTAERLRTKRLPMALQGRQSSVLILLSGNLLILGAVVLGWITFENVIEVANIFFIGNAFLGLVCGFRMLPSPAVRLGVGVLLVMMAFIAAFLPVYAIVFFLLVTAASLWVSRRRERLCEDLPD